MTDPNAVPADDDALVEAVARAILAADIAARNDQISPEDMQVLLDHLWPEWVPHAKAALSATPFARYRDALEEAGQCLKEGAHFAAFTAVRKAREGE